jgi:RNA recognition motif-containing protein
MGWCSGWDAGAMWRPSHHDPTEHEDGTSADFCRQCRVAGNRDTGRSRGFGFVEMPNAPEAQAAIDGLHGTSLGGRTVVVNEAREREERGGPRR